MYRNKQDPSWTLLFPSNHDSSSLPRDPERSAPNPKRSPVTGSPPRERSKGGVGTFSHSPFYSFPSVPPLPQAARAGDTSPSSFRKRHDDIVKDLQQQKRSNPQPVQREVKPVEALSPPGTEPKNPIPPPSMEPISTIVTPPTYSYTYAQPAYGVSHTYTQMPQYTYTQVPPASMQYEYCHADPFAYPNSPPTMMSYAAHPIPSYFPSYGLPPSPPTPVQTSLPVEKALTVGNPALHRDGPEKQQSAQSPPPRTRGVSRSPRSQSRRRQFAGLPPRDRIGVRARSPFAAPHRPARARSPCCGVGLLAAATIEDIPPSPALDEDECEQDETVLGGLDDPRAVHSGRLRVVLRGAENVPSLYRSGRRDVYVEIRLVIAPPSPTDPEFDPPSQTLKGYYRRSPVSHDEPSMRPHCPLNFAAFLQVRGFQDFVSRLHVHLRLVSYALTDEGICETALATAPANEGNDYVIGEAALPLRLLIDKQFRASAPQVVELGSPQPSAPGWSFESEERKAEIEERRAKLLEGCRLLVDFDFAPDLEDSQWQAECEVSPEDLRTVEIPPEGIPVAPSGFRDRPLSPAAIHARSKQPSPSVNGVHHFHCVKCGLWKDEGEGERTCEGRASLSSIAGGLGAPLCAICKDKTPSAYGQMGKHHHHCVKCGEGPGESGKCTAPFPPSYFDKGSKTPQCRACTIAQSAYSRVSSPGPAGATTRVTQSPGRDTQAGIGLGGMPTPPETPLPPPRGSRSGSGKKSKKKDKGKDKVDDFDVFGF